MRLLFSKFVRNYAKDYPPNTCYAGLYIPDSFNEICDCKTFCKFPPKGNTGIPNLDLLQNNSHQQPEIVLGKKIYHKNINIHSPIKTFYPNQILLRKFSSLTQIQYDNINTKPAFHSLHTSHNNGKKHMEIVESQLKQIIDNATETNTIDFNKLVTIQSTPQIQAEPSKHFKPGLSDCGELAISYMEHVADFKSFYESLPYDKPKFINLTIGGVYRKTPPKTDINSHRGYVTYLRNIDREYIRLIFKNLGIILEPDQVGVSPFRSKMALQHIFSLFKPGIIIAHHPNYKSTIDSARIDHNHQVIEVDIKGRYTSLFDEVRKQAELMYNTDNIEIDGMNIKQVKPIILLLVCPQNPCAITMSDEEEKQLHQLIHEYPIHVIHDIAYQGYTKNPRDPSKRYRDHGMPFLDQTYISIMSTSKSLYASGQPAFYTADKQTLPFLTDHYQRMGTGPTSTFIHDLKYYYDTLDNTYMKSVEDKLQKPLLEFIDNNKHIWGVDYLIRPDGPPFITLDIKNKLQHLNLTSEGYRELSLRLACPVLVNDGILRIALTGFDKSEHDEILPMIRDRLDYILSINQKDPILQDFVSANPIFKSIK